MAMQCQVVKCIAWPYGWVSRLCDAVCGALLSKLADR